MAIARLERRVTIPSSVETSVPTGSGSKSNSIVKGKITPEHKVRASQYNVTIKVDESESIIVSLECHDCVASCGGCKHSIAFLYWLLRRSEEPSPTSVECYWKKPLLSKVGTSVKLLKASDLKSGGQPVDLSERQGFREKAVNEAIGQNCEGKLKYFGPVLVTQVKKLSIHYLGLDFYKNSSSPDPDNFIEYCRI
ncbi:hypothetical protein NQ315_012280 [Exocentrus adspersus]|uniref:Uncharacterized protein n=1 Tax=Exocentrus adspersus TaxID=1586481 RepID=A0AAV8VFP0_9CUCU|nr:hypothetical protein NQ315_012280 [Exocentrus adspersus]